MRTNKDYLSRACYSKRVGHHHLCLAETLRQARDWERFTMGKKKEGFLYGGFWHGEVREANKRQA